jgi:hypothetical protein
MAQLLQCQHKKCEALSSRPSTALKKKKEQEEEVSKVSKIKLHQIQSLHSKGNNHWSEETGTEWRKSLPVVHSRGN